MGSFSWNGLFQSLRDHHSFFYSIVYLGKVSEDSFFSQFTLFPGGKKQTNKKKKTTHKSWQNISRSRKLPAFKVVYIGGRRWQIFSLLCSNSDCPGFILPRFYHHALVHYLCIYFYHCKERAVFPSRCYTNHIIALGLK